MPNQSDVPTLGVDEIVTRYDAVLLDSYGVLVDAGGALPGAHALLAKLQAADRPWLIVSNDASRSLAASAARYAALGLPIGPERILVSAALLADHFTDHGLVGARSIVLGPQDSVTWVEQAGGVVVPWDDPAPDAVVVCDDAGYPLVPAVEAVITTLSRRLAAGHRTALVLPNPDLVYPHGQGRLSLTAGSTALLIASALGAVLGDAAPGFVALGKPQPAIFHHACARLGVQGRAVVMLGDQIATDIVGARAAGLSTGLVRHGVTADDLAGWSTWPDFVVQSLQ